MVGLGEVVDDAIDVGFHIFRKLDVQMPVCRNVQRVGYAEMIPQYRFQRGIFVDPNDLFDGDDRHRLVGEGDEKVLRDIHVLRGELGKGGKLFFRLR